MDATRKVQNPLLSAAGHGYSYDYLAGNALLVPVTPTTPAILSDGEFALMKIKKNTSRVGLFIDIWIKK